MRLLTASVTCKKEERLSSATEGHKRSFEKNPHKQPDCFIYIDRSESLAVADWEQD